MDIHGHECTCVYIEAPSCTTRSQSTCRGWLTRWHNLRWSEADQHAESWLWARIHKDNQFASINHIFKLPCPFIVISTKVHTKLHTITQFRTGFVPVGACRRSEISWYSYWGDPIVLTGITGHTPLELSYYELTNIRQFRQTLQFFTYTVLSKEDNPTIQMYLVAGNKQKCTQTIELVII